MPSTDSSRGVVYKSLALYQGVRSSIPGSPSLSDEILSCGPVFRDLLNQNNKHTGLLNILDTDWNMSTDIFYLNPSCTMRIEIYKITVIHLRYFKITTNRIFYIGKGKQKEHIDLHEHVV